MTHRRIRKESKAKKRITLRKLKKEKPEIIQMLTKTAIKHHEPVPLVVETRQNTGYSKNKMDRKLLALPPGLRISKTGKLYYEYRDNRSDLYLNDAPIHLQIHQGLPDGEFLTKLESYKYNVKNKKELKRQVRKMFTSKKRKYKKRGRPKRLNKPKQKKKKTSIFDILTNQKKKGKRGRSKSIFKGISIIKTAKKKLGLFK